MRVIVCGAGQVGSGIARYVAAGAGNDVTVVDRSAELVGRLDRTLDVRTIIGHASSPDVLEQAGAQDCEVLIAATRSDETNMMACQVAHSLFNVPTKIARIRQRAYLDNRWAPLFVSEGMPVDAILSPERDIARSILRRLALPGATEILQFANGRVRLIGVRVGEDCPIIRTPLRQLTALFPDLNISVVGIVRGEKRFVPKAHDEMLPGDEVSFVADTAHTARAMAAFGREGPAPQRLVVIGGGNIGRAIAELAGTEYPQIRLCLIERDAARARELDEALGRHSLILQGDVLDGDLFEEANFEAADATVAVTDDDETNILTALIAKRHGARRTVSLVNKATYGALVGPLDIDVVVNPRSITVSQVLRHLRRGRILSAFCVGDGFGEALEVEVLETSMAIGRDLRKFKVWNNTMVGAILRGDEVMIPRGRTIIRQNDRVVLFGARSEILKAAAAFGVGSDYFG